MPHTSSAPRTPGSSQQSSQVRYFRCTICNANRPNNLLANPDEDDNICRYCVLCIGDEEVELKYCTGCRAEHSRTEFMEGEEEKHTCQACRTRPTRQPLPEHIIHDHSAERLRRSQQRTPRRTPVQQGNRLQEPAVSEEHWSYITNFNNALDDLSLEECTSCNECWFDMQIEDGICHFCRAKPNRQHLYSAANNNDVGSVPAHLPELSEIEEMLIARAHVHIQLRKIKGQQLKYSGHTVTFMQNTQKIFTKLPLLPRDVDIILLKPAAGTLEVNNRINQTFEQAFRVRRSCVQLWLNYLKASHPDYRDIEIDEANLAALPTDGSVQDQMSTALTAPDQEGDLNQPEPHDNNELPNNNESYHTNEPHDNNEPDENNEHHDQNVWNENDGRPDDDTINTTAMVPNVPAELTELDRLRSDLRGDRSDPTAAPDPNFNLSVATFQQTPISERENIPILRMIFPTLFPRGEGEFHLPRENPLSFEDWIRHLLRYKDGRFATHSRFRYVVFNMLMRQRSSKQASWVCRNTNTDVDFEGLQELIRNGDDQGLVGRISRSAAQLRGTRPYWGKKRSELEAMIHNLSSPHLFFTFSAADIQWHDLQRHMPGFRGQGDEFVRDPNRHRTAMKNLAENPHIAADYLVRRFEAFFEHVVKKIFNVADYWYRYEWQQRGSGHIHGFLWLENERPPSTADIAARARIVDLWKTHVTAVNPEPGQPQLGVNPASLPFAEQSNTKQFLAESVNRYQRHRICTPSYCLRKKVVRTRQETREGVQGPAHEGLHCRFKFPKAHRETAAVTRDENPTHWKFMPERNDTLMNSFIPTLSLGWSANTDMSPCTNANAVLNYIAKYASKSETKSSTYKEMFAEATKNCSTRSPLFSAATKMMNALITERDWTAQEVNHHLLGLSLVESSRVVVNLDLRSIEDRTTAVEFEDGSIQKRGKSWLEKYTNRLTYQPNPGVSVEDLTLIAFVRRWVVVGNSIKERPRAKPRVLNVYPRYKADPGGSDYEEFCRIKLMLHHPFLDDNGNDLKSAPNDDTEPTFSYSYQRCMASGCLHEQDPLDPLDPLDNEEEVESEYEDAHDDHEPDGTQPAFVHLAERTGRVDAAYVALETTLGHRPQDLVYDWHVSDNFYELYGDRASFYEDANELTANIPRTYNDPSTLQPSQRRCFDLVMGHYESENRLDGDGIEGHDNEPLLMHVDGSAGTGKSYLIDMISTHLYERARELEKPDPVLRAAPTGVAAFNIHGRTLHSLLRLPVRKQLVPLSTSALIRLQSTFKPCRFLIIDEKSMLGLRQLHWIDSRLRQIFPRSADQPFGGLNIILLGDFFQLPPVCEKALYDARPPGANNDTMVSAQILYRLFNKTVLLTQIMRQQGEDELSVRFRQALENLRHGSITDDGFNLLSSRVFDKITEPDRRQFVDSLRLYPTKEMVQLYNLKTLEKKREPIIIIKAKHNCQAAAQAPDDDAEGLPSMLLISKGARIMIKNNLLTAFGIVNGTMGILHDIIWKPDDDPFTNLPFMILFKPDTYSDNGPHLFLDNGKPIVPIFPITREWEDGTRSLSRTMFPIALAYAITVHKSQGLTLDRIVLDLSERDFVGGLTYVAISRTRHVTGLMFDRAFTKQRFHEKPTAIRAERSRDHERRNR